MQQASLNNPVSLSEKPATTRFIGRHKKCGFVKAVDMPKVEKRGMRTVMGERGWERVPYTYMEANRPAFMICPNCPGRHVSWEKIEGRFSEKHKCDARCMNAIGPNCDCSCGGANHGAGWL